MQSSAQAISTWTGFLMLGFSIGPLVGGVMTHYVGMALQFLAQRRRCMFPAALMLWRLHARAEGAARWTGQDWAARGLRDDAGLGPAFPGHGSAAAPLCRDLELAMAAIAWAVLIRAEGSNLGRWSTSALFAPELSVASGW